MARSPYTTAHIQFRAGDLDAQLAARALGSESHGALTVTADHQLGGPDAPSTQPESKSEVARRDLHRYYALLDAVRPAFSAKEASLLCDMMLDQTMGDRQAATFARLLVHELSDALDLGRLDAAWTAVARPLLARLRAMTVPELVATVDAIEQYWVQPEDASQRLRAVGLVASS